MTTPGLDPEARFRYYRRHRFFEILLVAWVFPTILIVLATLAADLLIATPRSGQQPPSTAAVLNGAPRPSLVEDNGAPPPAPRVARSDRSRGAGLLAGPPETHIGEPLIVPDTATDVSGTASWFCGGGSACTRGYPPGTFSAAAGPALRVGDWRGRIVKVCSARACVKVALNDWCACPRRVIDLYRVAFARIANPSRGLVRVTVSWGGQAIVVPPTDTR